MSPSLSRKNSLLVLPLIVALAALLVSAAARRASAQSQESPRGLEGTWRVQGTLLNCATGVPLGAPPIPSRVSFARGGTATAIVSSPVFQPGQRTPSLGVWRLIGPQTYSLVHEAFILFPAGNFQKGTQRITETIQTDGDQYTSVSSSQFFDANDNPIGVPGCATATGTRIQ